MWTVSSVFNELNLLEVCKFGANICFDLEVPSIIHVTICFSIYPLWQAGLWGRGTWQLSYVGNWQGNYDNYFSNALLHTTLILKCTYSDLADMIDFKAHIFQQLITVINEFLSNYSSLPAGWREPIDQNKGLVKLNWDFINLHKSICLDKNLLKMDSTGPILVWLNQMFYPYKLIVRPLYLILLPWQRFVTTHPNL